MLTVLARKVRDMETDLKSLSQKLGLNFDPDGPLGEDERVFRLCSLTVLSHCALSLCSLTVLSHCALSLCSLTVSLPLCSLSVLSHCVSLFDLYLLSVTVISL
jgi:hypothetical protein